MLENQIGLRFFIKSYFFYQKGKCTFENGTLNVTKLLAGTADTENDCAKIVISEYLKATGVLYRIPNKNCYYAIEANVTWDKSSFNRTTLRYRSCIIDDKFKGKRIYLLSL